MAYEDDRDMELDRQLYEEDPAYEADTYFGERLNEPVSDGSGAMGAEEYDEDEAGVAPTGGFGESLAQNPEEARTNADEQAADDSNEPSSDQMEEDL